MSRVLSWNDIQEITGDKKFQELYAKYNQSDAIHGENNNRKQVLLSLFNLPDPLKNMAAVYSKLLKVFLSKRAVTI